MDRHTTNFTDDELGFIQIVSVAILTAAARDELDLNDLARRELANRGLDHNGQWVGFDNAQRIHDRSRR
jgi:hypothetical protein